MIETDVLIIGAGLTGLSCAWHLERLGKPRYILAEKNPHIGGLCASFKRGGFTFDCSGHLLHLHGDYGKKLVPALLKGNLEKIPRDARIYSHGVYTPYPFQAATYGLPDKVVSDCVSGFLKAWLRKKEAPFDAPFDEWALSVFGEGICRHFMFPYNKKLWRTPLSVLRADWCAPFVPRPNPADVIRGAYMPQRKRFGYNAVFHYPKTGGMQSLCDAFADGLANGLRAESEVLSVSLRKKTALVKNLGEVRFKRLVNTMPLKDFCGIITDAPQTIRRSAQLLKCTRVDVFNIGFSSPAKTPAHWVYFPEGKFRFYRAGLASNFSAAVAPEKSASFYVEVSGKPPAKPAAMLREISADLKNCGLVGGQAEISDSLHLEIPCAYVVYDKNRAAAVKKILEWLERGDCVSAGRYGGWKYSFMEEAIQDGRAAAEKSAA
ncbi:MAG: FAD-dependent oxidoreductase [Elusimicrobiales bacterium]|nr:FAD-dependent oxidoreductase [Elusimicrobiales bacterium]